MVSNYLNTCFQHFGAWLPSSTPTASSPSILRTCAAWSFMCPGEEFDLFLFPSSPSPPQDASANCASTSSQRVWIPSVQQRRAARRNPSRLRQIVSRSRLWSLLNSPPSIAATPFVTPTSIGQASVIYNETRNLSNKLFDYQILKDWGQLTLKGTEGRHFCEDLPVRFSAAAWLIPWHILGTLVKIRW